MTASTLKARISEQHTAIKNENGKPIFTDEVLNSDPLSTIELYRNDTRPAFQFIPDAEIVTTFDGQTITTIATVRRSAPASVVILRRRWPS